MVDRVATLSLRCRPHHLGESTVGKKRLLRQNPRRRMGGQGVLLESAFDDFCSRMDSDDRADALTSRRRSQHAQLNVKHSVFVDDSGGVERAVAVGVLHEVLLVVILGVPIVAQWLNLRGDLAVL